MALNINGTTGISGVDGSVSAPAVTGTDSNTGITFPAADTIKFATGGVERLAISNSGLSGDGSGLTGIQAGITMAESWRVTTEYTSTGGATVFPSNWERDDNNRSGHIGASGMSQSGGVFTFPSTGIYLISWLGYGRAANSSSVSLAAQTIVATGDNSSYSTVSITYYSIPAIGLYNYGWGGTDFMMDVTDTSTDKVKLGNYSADYVTWETQTNYNLNIATFLRLGDT